MECWSNAFIPLQHSLFGTWWGACPKRKPKDRFLARLASETFLTGLGTEIFRCQQALGKWSANLSGSRNFRKVCAMMGEFLGSEPESRLKEEDRV